MTYKPGDDVVVEFDGIKHRGEVLTHSGPWVRCTIAIDPTADYGKITPSLAPRSTVCVRDKWVTPFSPATS